MLTENGIDPIFSHELLAVDIPHQLVVCLHALDWSEPGFSVPFHFLSNFLQTDIFSANPNCGLVGVGVLVIDQTARFLPKLFVTKQLIRQSLHICTEWTSYFGKI